MAHQDYSRTVYTTEAGRICPSCSLPVKNCVCKNKNPHLAAGNASVFVSIERKGRGGKTVTVISGFRLPKELMRQLTIEMKRRCGSGGTIKGNNIEIQGDHRDILLDLLNHIGIKAKRGGG